MFLGSLDDVAGSSHEKAGRPVTWGRRATAEESTGERPMMGDAPAEPPVALIDLAGIISVALVAVVAIATRSPLSVVAMISVVCARIGSGLKTNSICHGQFCSAAVCWSPSVTTSGAR